MENLSRQRQFSQKLMRTLSSQAVPDIDRLNASLAAQFQRRPSEHLVVAGAVALLGHKWEQDDIYFVHSAQPFS
jgi:hypothetical protein